MSQGTCEGCPLCRRSALVASIDLHRKHYKCSACGEFVVLRSAERRLAKAASTTLERYANEVRATTNPDYIYVIAGPTPDAPAHVDLQGESRLRADALR